MDKVTALKENVKPFVLGLASLFCVAIMFCNLVLLFWVSLVDPWGSFGILSIRFCELECLLFAHLCIDFCLMSELWCS